MNNAVGEDFSFLATFMLKSSWIELRPSDIKASATPKRTLRPGAGCNPLAGVK